MKGWSTIHVEAHVSMIYRGFSRSFSRIATALLLLIVSASVAHAGCPRSGWEQTRRIVPSVMFWPAAPFILRHKPRTAQMPPAGEVVRVSRRDDGGRTHFVTGRLVAFDSSGVTLAAGGAAPQRIPMISVRCVQVPRRSAAAGAANGVTVGLGAGLAAAGVASFVPSNGESRADEFAFGSFVFGAMGSVLGIVIGTGAKGTSWDTVLDRS